MRRVVVFAVAAAIALAPVAVQADIEPLVPPPAIEFDISPIEPLAPVLPDSPAAGSANDSGPRPPTPPRAPTPPDLAGQSTPVQDRVGEIATRLNQLYTQAVSTGASDATGFSQLTADQLFQALQSGREIFANPSSVAPPQTAVDGSGCPGTVPAGTLREGAESIGAKELCEKSVAQASTPEAARAIEWAFRQLGAPYACEGVGRLNPYRFDCSSLVTRAYSEGAGLATAGPTWAPSTRDLMPWDGIKLADWAEYVSPQDARPGDLALYRSCTTEPCSFQHVVMILADGYMLHTNRCGDVAHVKKFTGFDSSSGFAVARRVDPEKARP